MAEKSFTNRLITETSPYLLQHAHNPVSWYPWNDETLELAKNENKLLLISIGYAACHWCHVMEHECFEDEEVAAVMNKYFINVKVDREERPDVDQVYMTAVQLMSGRGGWPLNCVALPDGRPLWGGTYFPKANWINALEQLARLFDEKPEEAITYAEKLTKGVRNASLVTMNSSELSFSVNDLDNSIEEWQQIMDIDLGGRGGAPKFPMPNNYDFLLRYAIQKNDPEIMEYVSTSLRNMAYGGIYDQIGGGFSRYSVDKKWHVPHFEKMLYDNGQLVSLYAKAYQVSKDLLYKNTVYQTLDFIERELTSEEGAFFSSLDADSVNSDGKLEEGAFYVWNEEELKELLKEDFELFAAYYNVNNYGYWEHDNYVLIRNKGDYEISSAFNMSVDDLRSKVKIWKERLLVARNKKDRPRLDDKVLTSWNALMLKGYIDAYTVFQEERFLEVALKNARFIYGKQLEGNGRLWHNYKEGKSSINGYLEDYALVIDAFMSLYEATLNEQWLHTSKALTDYTFDHFFDDKSGMFFFTSNEDKALISRKIELEDNVIPASNSVMARNLFKLSHYYSNNYYEKVSKKMLHTVKERTISYGSAYSNWQQLLCDIIGPFYEIAITGKNAAEASKVIHQNYFPNSLICGSLKDSTLPLLLNRFKNDQTLVYVCQKGACELPVEEAETAIKQLRITF